MNKLNATHSLEDHDFGELAKTESKTRARTRLYTLHQYRISKQSFEIAENLSINIETVRRTRRRILTPKQPYLQTISQAVPIGRHAVVVMDGAVWHKQSYSLPNLSIMKLPPYSPELNPIEQVWQYIKQHWLSNRCFDSYEAIVDATCQAWCSFAEQVATIKSFTARLGSTLIIGFGIRY